MGNKFIDEIARELRMSFPNIKGFSIRNLKSMKKYYLICSQNEKVQTASAQIPWSHNMLILDKIKDNNKRIWYMRHFISNNLIEQKYIKNMVLKHDNEITILHEILDKFKQKNETTDEK